MRVLRHTVLILLVVAYVTAQAQQQVSGPKIDANQLPPTTGTGNVVLATNPTLVNPALGTPSVIVLTNATGTPSAIVLTNATGLPCAALPALTGDATSSAGSCASTVSAVNGAALPASATFAGTNSSKQIVAVTNAPVYKVLTANFTTSSGTGLQAITGLSFSLPASTAQNVPITCQLVATQATEAADAVGIGASVTPTRIDASGFAFTSTTAVISGNLVDLTSTTATAIVSYTPTVTTETPIQFTGLIQQPSTSASTIQVYAKQGTSADTIVFLAGSWCRIW